MPDKVNLTDEELEKVSGGKSVAEIINGLQSYKKTIPDVGEVINLFYTGDWSGAMAKLDHLIKNGHSELQEIIN